MSPPIRVVCAEPPLQSALQNWLDEGRLTPPCPLTLQIEVGPLAPPAQDATVPFRQGAVAIRPGADRRSLTIDWETAPARAQLLTASPCARVTLSAAAVERLEECQRSFLLAVLVFLLRRAGWHHVHGASTVDRTGRGWLLAGNSQAGKSTTTALLASRGWRVGTDDIAFLAPADGRVAVHGFRSRIALRPGGLELLARAGGVPLPERGKTGFWPEDLGAEWVSQVEPEILVFPSIGEERTGAKALGPGETLAQLVRWSAWVMLEPELAQEHLELLAALGRQARAYQVRLGRDLFENPNLMDELIP